MSDLPADAKSDTASARGCTATAAGSFSRNGSVLAPLRLTADIHAAVHSIAAELDRSPSWVRRRALKEFIERHRAASVNLCASHCNSPKGGNS
jgi:hypothetical protein